MITEKNNVFYCDCGFSWRRGMSGSHNCEDRLRAKLTDQAVQLANAESKRRGLAAENAGLKNALEWLYETVSSESVSVPNEKYSSVTNAAQVLSETPATDSFLAEVRAQGVEMLHAVFNQAGCVGSPELHSAMNTFMLNIASKIRNGEFAVECKGVQS
ncbi:hypothetical protein [Enterobacter hormaechei]|uniref:hypothetical protein n=1 Tax=Enterobacter hormaechei TaxID=158836 RepID=UPI001A435F17|nr:hypothetical protein [Enterobacter hormaechei]